MILMLLMIFQVVHFVCVHKGTNFYDKNSQNMADN